MSRIRPPWTLLLCAAVLALVLGGENRWLMSTPRAERDIPAATAKKPAAAAPARLDPPSINRYLEIAERPLFIPDRRPQPQAVTAIKPGPPAPVMLVEGVVLSQSHRYAVIKHGNPPKLDSVAEGATIDGWQVEHIDPDAIALRSGSSTATYPVGKPGTDTSQQPNRFGPRPPPE